MSCARWDTEAFAPADRLLLADLPGHADSHARDCEDCGSASCCTLPNLSAVQPALLAALAHGHAVTIVPHADDHGVDVVIHPRECECQERELA